MTDDKDFSYKAISELSDATEDVQAESAADSDLDEIGDYQALCEATQQKLKILSDSQSEVSSRRGAEVADEFLRNFFIKFGMKKTLESFQTEWYELKAQGELDTSKMPPIPPIYRRN